MGRVPEGDYYKYPYIFKGYRPRVTRSGISRTLGLTSVTVPSAFKVQPPVAVAETLRESVYDLCAANGMSRDLARLCFGSNLELGLFMKPVPIPSALRGDVAQRVQELLPRDYWRRSG